ncbi:undecaprenyl-phosphate glucose phosphotransferase [soil metagenome]
MSRLKEKILLLLSDAIFVNLAWTIYYVFRVNSGWIKYANPPAFIEPLIVIYIYWLIIFSFTGLYKNWFVRSRFDELVSVLKAVTLGSVLLFFLIFIDDYISNAPIVSRFLILIYWTLMVTLAASGRIIIRSYQKILLNKGIGLRSTLIIANPVKAEELKSQFANYLQLGFKVNSVLTLNRTAKDPEYLSSVSRISENIDKFNITEIIIALEPEEKSALPEIIKYGSQRNVNMMIIPDMYDIVSGMAKTNQIYGIPLIDVLPDTMSSPGKLTKRIFDILFALLIIIALLPLHLIVIIVIKLTSKGPVFYKQARIGKKDKVFNLYKYRTLDSGTEEYAKDWQGRNDSRITKFGMILRKVYFDETPQAWNVLVNDMSIIGPRPEIPELVNKLKNEIPFYYKRLSVKPGITGWAQLKYSYEEYIENIKDKIQYDFYYIENMSLKLDFKILINTFIVIVLMKGH